MGDEIDDDARTRRALDGHAERRRQGLATVSVLVGSPAAAVALAASGPPAARVDRRRIGD